MDSIVFCTATPWENAFLFLQKNIFLRFNTKTIDPKTSSNETEPFGSNIGSPQGDGISGCFFNIYFEYSLRRVRKLLKGELIRHDHSYSKVVEITIPEEAIYADDADFITNSIEARNQMKTQIKGILEVDNLLVNESKTEITTLERKKKRKKKTDDNVDEPWREVIKLGSKIGDEEDIMRRKNLASIKLKEMTKLWIRNNYVRRNTKIRLYKAVVEPVLLYNAATWGLTKSDEKNLDSFHRKQLRIVLNIKYPDKMKNKDVYRITEEKPLTLQILRSRWKLFGHILRLDDRTPAKISMKHYYSPSTSPKFKGRPRQTLPKTLSDDLVRTVKEEPSFYNDFKVAELKTLNELEKLNNIA